MEKIKFHAKSDSDIMYIENVGEKKNQTDPVNYWSVYGLNAYS